MPCPLATCLQEEQRRRREEDQVELKEHAAEMLQSQFRKRAARKRAAKLNHQLQQEAEWEDEFY